MYFFHSSDYKVEYKTSNNRASINLHYILILWKPNRQILEILPIYLYPLFNIGQLHWQINNVIKVIYLNYYKCKLNNWYDP